MESQTHESHMTNKKDKKVMKNAPKNITLQKQFSTPYFLHCGQAHDE